jgi:bifunctional DNA-binding transcriptional regulator/antitoxin component of YhaV-PrlF toxin-antitoxin module
MELRRVFGLSPDDEIEIFVEDDKILLQKTKANKSAANASRN